MIAALAAPPPASARRAAPSNAGPLAAVPLDRPAPDFTFDIGEGPEHLSALQGKPVLLHFWASWCEPCVEELPALARARAAFPGVPIVTLSYEPPGDARQYLKARGLDVPVAEDPQKTVFTRYSITPLPTTVLIRADGTVKAVWIGEMAYDEIVQALASVATPASP